MLKRSLGDGPNPAAYSAQSILELWVPLSASEAASTKLPDSAVAEILNGSARPIGPERSSHYMFTSADGGSSPMMLDLLLPFENPNFGDSWHPGATLPEDKCHSFILADRI